MKYVISNGSTHRIIEMDSVQKKLPLGTYNLLFDSFKNQWYLSKVADLEIPGKIYGDMSVADRIISVYKEKERNVGILLFGLKGSGKTVLARLLCRKLNQPVIMIPSNFGDQSVSALDFLSEQALGDCTILIDEFEKKFSSDDDTPLTLLDGPAQTHHFFILTANESNVNENLQNRPGRIYYSIHYSGLADSVIRDVANDLLKNKDNLESLLSVCDEIPNLSFDMLISVIKDMNMFNETAKEAIKWFGFNREPMYANVYQKINGKLAAAPCIENYYLNTTGNYGHYWASCFIDPCCTIKDEVCVCFGRMEKVKKNIYLITETIIPEAISECDTEEEKMNAKSKLISLGVQFLPDSYKVKLDFEVRLSSNISVKSLIF